MKNSLIYGKQEKHFFDDFRRRRSFIVISDMGHERK
jgi:hypothetical protein